MQVRLFRELTVRGLLLRLTLSGWMNAHGEYPGRLDDLSDAGSAATIDPYTGSDFGYRPAGFPSTVPFINPTTFRQEIIPAAEPVLWSAGPHNVRIVAIHQEQKQPPRFEAVDSTGPIDENKARHIGAYVFKLP